MASDEGPGRGPVIGEWQCKDNLEISIPPTGMATVVMDGKEFSVECRLIRGNPSVLSLAQDLSLPFHGLALTLEKDVRGALFLRHPDGRPVRKKGSPPTEAPPIGDGSSAALDTLSRADLDLWRSLDGIWVDSYRTIQVDASALEVRWLSSSVHPAPTLGVTDVAVARSSTSRLAFNTTYPGGYDRWFLMRTKENEVALTTSSSTSLMAREKDPKQRPQPTAKMDKYVRPDTMMMLMLVLTSGKRDFDLWTQTCSTRHLFSKAQIKALLTAANKRRLDPDIQERLSEKDCTHHFHRVNIDMHREVLEKHGYPHEYQQDALLELFSARNDYQHDAEMVSFMSELVHVKGDRTPSEIEDAAGLQPGDAVPTRLPLHTLNGKPTALADHLNPGRKMVLVCGSWS